MKTNKLQFFKHFLADPFQLSHFSQHFSSHNPQFVFPHADSAFHKYQQHANHQQHAGVHHGSKNKETIFSEHKSVSWSNDEGKQKRRSSDKNAPEYLI